MNQQEKISLMALPVIVLLAAGLAWVGGQGGRHLKLALRDLSVSTP